MLTLRLTEYEEAAQEYRVEAALEDNGMRQTAVSRFTFALPPADAERVRWYLEDFLEYPLDPAPEIAADVERLLVQMGGDLFSRVFGEGDSRDLWATARGRLSDMRVEVVSEVTEGTGIPWELLRDPRTDVALALGARSFVRSHHQSAQPFRPRPSGGEELRVLLVICRPAGAADVPFRSVASLLVRLSGEAREHFQLDVLRPPTFARLSEVLRTAADAGKPYHVVHFDGHGTYGDLAEVRAREGAGPARLGVLSPSREGAHGFLLFEDPAVAGNQQLVDGPPLGKLLADAGVPVLVLNACRSAHAEAPTAPDDAAGARDVHARVRAYGSLAHEIADAGVPGVVAMRYNVWVATAAQFVGDLYEALLSGRGLGEAVSVGRKQLAADPKRTIAFDPEPLQDWMVPVVYEAAALTVVARPVEGGEIQIRLDPAAAQAERGAPSAALPDRPDVGFVGRDDTLLALDRAFDTQRVVLLHAYAGSGKTTTAAEFARWYQHTGGLAGPQGRSGTLLFSSFERHTPLAQVIDQLCEAFDPTLQANGIDWQALDDEQQHAVALQLLGQLPVLWVWDNVEPITGFPEGTASAWSDEEQRELRSFLAAVSNSRTKILLTSRGDERAWLGDLPARVELDPMPLRDSVQLARAIVERHPPHRLSDVEDWRPLLRYAAGNPLTITVLVGQAVRQGMTSRAQLEAFVKQLRDGEVAITDDERHGRAASLGASLSYGFDTAFTELERARLAVLHLFRDFVDVDAIRTMGDENMPERVPELAGVTAEEMTELLDRAAGIGLLTDRGGGYYAIHPALPWYFGKFFEAAYGQLGQPRADTVAAAYVATMYALAGYYSRLFDDGRLRTLDPLKAEEANLLHARALARDTGRLREAVGCMTGLSRLYRQTGRHGEWSRLVEELGPYVTDPDSDGPRTGLEEPWSIHLQWRISQATEARDWPLAERLQQARLEWEHSRAAPSLDLPDAELDDDAAWRIRSLGIVYGQLGTLRREQARADCVEPYQQALALFRRIGDRRQEGNTCFNLGTAYLDVPGLTDLEAAERWYMLDLELTDEEDVVGRARTLGELGGVAYRRFLEGRDRGEPAEVLTDHLTRAATLYLDSLRLLPEDAVDDIATVHNQLGSIYDEVDSETAIEHYRRAIAYREMSGDVYGAGGARFNAAVAYAAVDLRTALLYARTSLRDFERVGTGAAADAEDARNLIAKIEAAIAAREAQDP